MHNRTYNVTCLYTQGRWKGKQLIPKYDSLIPWNGEVKCVPANVRIATSKVIQKEFNCNSPIFTREIRYTEKL